MHRHRSPYSAVTTRRGSPRELPCFPTSFTNAGFLLAVGRTTLIRELFFSSAFKAYLGKPSTRRWLRTQADCCSAYLSSSSGLIGQASIKTGFSWGYKIFPEGCISHPRPHPPQALRIICVLFALTGGFKLEGDLVVLSFHLLP